MTPRLIDKLTGEEFGDPRLGVVVHTKEGWLRIYVRDDQIMLASWEFEPPKDITICPKSTMDVRIKLGHQS